MGYDNILLDSHCNHYCNILLDMKEFKGTPFTWKSRKRQSNAMDVVSGGETPICIVANHDIKGESTANAKLISAAPELLDACQSALRIKDLWCYETDGSQSEGLSKFKEEHWGEIQAVYEMRDKLESAINKALG